MSKYHIHEKRHVIPGRKACKFDEPEERQKITIHELGIDRAAEGPGILSLTNFQALFRSFRGKPIACFPALFSGYVLQTAHLSCIRLALSCKQTFKFLSLQFRQSRPPLELYSQFFPCMFCLLAISQLSESITLLRAHLSRSFNHHSTCSEGHVVSWVEPMPESWHHEHGQSAMIWDSLIHYSERWRMKQSHISKINLEIKIFWLTLWKNDLRWQQNWKLKSKVCIIAKLEAPVSVAWSDYYTESNFTPPK